MNKSTIALYDSTVLVSLIVPLALYGNSVSFSSTGVTVRQLLVQVGDQVGRKYRVSSTIAPDVVAVQVQDVDPEDFEAQLAHALGARWQSDGERKLLELDPAVIQAEADERREAWKRGLERAKRAYTKRLQTTPTFDQKLAQTMLRRVDDRIAKEEENSEFGLTDALNREGNLPISRLLARLVTTLPAETLMNLTPNSRLVYAQRPNLRQKPLPAAANAAIKAFLQEESTWETAQATFRAQSSKTSEIASLPSSGKIVLVVSSDENGNGGAISVAVVGPDGKCHLDSVTGIEDWDEEAAARYRIAPTAVAGESRVPESDLTQLMRKICQKWPDDAPPKILPTADLRSVLLNPVENEPLGFIPGELWSNTARARRRNLIGYMADSDFSFVPDPAEGPRTPSTVLQRLGHHHRVEEDDRWLLIYPKNFAMTRLNRLDRKLNQTLLQQALAKGGYQIEDAAVFRAGQPNGYPFYEWPNGYLNAFLPSVAVKSGIDLSIETEELELYGLLTPEQRAELRRRPIDLASLPKLRSVLEERVYGDEWGSRYGRYEVTELYSQGLPKSITLALVSDEASESVQPVSSDPKEFTFYSPSYSAAQLGSSLASDLSQNWTSYRRVQSRVLQLKVDFGNGFSQPIRLRETRLIDAQPVPFDRLPAEFRQAATAARQEALRNPKSKVIPPPR